MNLKLQDAVGNTSAVQICADWDGVHIALDQFGEICEVGNGYCPVGAEMLLRVAELPGYDLIYAVENGQLVPVWDSRQLPLAGEPVTEPAAPNRVHVTVTRGEGVWEGNRDKDTFYISVVIPAGSEMMPAIRAVLREFGDYTVTVAD